MYIYLNCAGLGLDIIGALLMFYFGIPQMANRGGQSYLLLEGVDTEQVERAKRYDKYARLGLIALVMGFAIQFVSNALQL